MRLVGNKTHGDLAEIAIPEFINQFMYDFKSRHVGKELFRAKTHEEDIAITNEIKNIDFTISLKAYGVGPLQLSTDKDFKMFSKLKEYGTEINKAADIKAILEDEAFNDFENINVLPLIYDERLMKCNILVFDFERTKRSVKKISYIGSGKRGRKHPVYRFYNSTG